MTFSKTRDKKIQNKDFFLPAPCCIPQNYVRSASGQMYQDSPGIRQFTSSAANACSVYLVLGSLGSVGYSFDIIMWATYLMYRLHTECKSHRPRNFM